MLVSRRTRSCAASRTEWTKSANMLRKPQPDSWWTALFPDRKEALSLESACEKFHVHLYGRRFELVSDHEPLEVYSPRSWPSARIEKWVLQMQRYSFQVVHMQGHKNMAYPLHAWSSRAARAQPQRTTNIYRLLQAMPRCMRWPLER